MKKQELKDLQASANVTSGYTHDKAKPGRRCDGSLFAGCWPDAGLLIAVLISGLFSDKYSV